METFLETLAGIIVIGLVSFSIWYKIGQWYTNQISEKERKEE